MSGQTVVVVAIERCFADDVAAPCPRCGRPTFFRPHTALLPFQRMCIVCYAANWKPGDRIAVTPETLREVRLYFGAKGRPQ